MILEHAWLTVKAGEEDAFEASIRSAMPILDEIDGCYGAEVRRQVENPCVYLLFIRWSSVEAHMAFRELPAFVQWRALTAPFYSEPAVVLHFNEPI